MLGAYFSPLAPAVVLLLSAFILPVVIPRLPAHRHIQNFSAPVVVGLALLSLLGVRLTFGSDATGQGLELVSGWNFSTTQSVAALVVRADNLSLPFLIVALLVLLAVMLLRSAPPVATAGQRNWLQIAGWLALGGSVCWLFVSANGLTLVYAVALFDALTSLYWLSRNQRNLAVARLFLAVLTGAGVVLSTLVAAANAMPGAIILGLALWLRLGLYPLLEAPAHAHRRSDERLTYLGLSLAVGIYLTIRLVSDPLPAAIHWLTLMTMLLAGLMTWLSGVSTEANNGRRDSLLVWLILTESLLILLAAPLQTGVAIAFAVGLILSLVALWVTPALGKPRFGERAWSWPYLPAAAATLNLVGLPLWLGWPVRVAIYRSLFDVTGVLALLLIILAEALALSGLVRYWLILVRGSQASSRHSAVGIVAMVPFLTPGLAPFILSALTGAELSLGSAAQSSGAWVVVVLLVSAAVGLDYFRPAIIARFNLSVPLLSHLLGLHWLFHWGEGVLNQVGKIVLRVRVMLEGQHYLGWAIFTALVGALIILLRT